MNTLRRFSRRAWLLHGYLIAMLILLPVPQANSYWTDSNGDRVKEWAEDPPQGDSWWDVDSDGDNLTNAQEALFGSDPYRIDADFDGLTDLVERDYADLTATLDPWNWDSDGDGFSDHDEYYQYIQGYTPVVNYHNLGGVFHSYYDADGDGLHNQDDTIPANMDRDGDFILNWNDSYPDDSSNGYVPPTTDPGVWIGGMWYPTGTLDSDNDGTPDPFDPYPWGSFWYNSIQHGGTWSDRDGDGVPDPADPFPDGSHWYNGVEHGGPWVDQDGDNLPDHADPWPMVAGSFWYNATEYPGGWSDQDGDNIPDPADPSPNGSYWWNGTEYLGPWVDQDGDGIPDAFDFTPNGGSSYWYNGTQYVGTWSDADSDGIPDPLDATPTGGYWYNGTEYAGVWSDQDIDGIPDPADATPNGSYWYNGTEYAGVWTDSDGDSIPDAQDAWPTDVWNGEPHYGYNGSEYAGTWTDRDGDNVPDPADSWPDDPENGLDSDGDGLSNYAERTVHGTDPGKVDSDDDYLTDYEELYAFHTSPLLPISDAAGGQTLLDGYVHLGADSDADGLPNRLEQHYATLGYALDPANPADAAGDLDGDGYTNAQAYHFGWSLIANLSQYDYDGDRIPDAIEDAWNALHPGVLNKALFADAVADFDGDGLFNFEEVGLLLPLPDGGTRPADPGSAHTVHTLLTDGQVAAWQQAILSLPAASPLRSWADADLDGLPDGYVLAEYEFYFYSTACNGYDEDGDGMSDLWEYRHSFNLRDWENWDDDPDGDTLGNLAEFQGGTHPRIADTAGDGFNDNLELSAGTNALLRSSTPAQLPLVLYVSSGNYQSAQPGAALPEPLVVQATRGGVPWPGAATTFSAPAGSFTATTVTTGTDGRASTGYTVAALPELWQVPVLAAAAEVETTLFVQIQDVDTDLDGWADRLEQQYGSSSTNVQATPATQDPALARQLRAYDTDSLLANDHWYVSQDTRPPPTNPPTPYKPWSSSHSWYYLGDMDYVIERQTSRPNTALRTYPFQVLTSDAHWQRSRTHIPFRWDWYDASVLGPQDFVPNESYLPIVNRWDVRTSHENGNSQELGWGLHWKRYRLSMPGPLSADYEENYLQVTYKWDKDNAVWVDYDPSDPFSDGYWIYPAPTVKEATPVKMTLRKGQTKGDWLTVTPVTLENELLSVHLLPVELAPEKLASNGDFDEGETGGTAAQETGAKADNRNRTLIAKRDSVDGRVKAGDVVTDDLHQGWFGLRPGVMPDDFFNGANVTISKKEKTDPATGKPESGNVRFFATWGDKQELAIRPDDATIDEGMTPDPAAGNLVGKVYGTNKTVPSGAAFWIEGVSPGKITLEYRIQKGSTDIKHEQTFEVRNDWTKAQWLSVVRDEIYLDSFTSSSGAAKNGFSNTGIDMNQYVVANDFLPNRPYIYSVYEYYAKLHDKKRDKFLWAGLAKLAGGPVYAGMSDAQYGKEGAAIPRGVGIIAANALQSIQDLLIDANINIYNDLAYQFVAFRTGGIKSMKYLKDQQIIDDLVYDAWKQLDEDGDVSSANQTLLQREQRDILRITYLNLDAMLDGWVSWLFSIMTNNPIPGGPSFQTVIPNGNIAIYNDRWAWITDAQQGMWPLWVSKPNTQRQSLANQNLRSNAAGFSFWLNLLPLR